MIKAKICPLCKSIMTSWIEILKIDKDNGKGIKIITILAINEEYKPLEEAIKKAAKVILE